MFFCERVSKNFKPHSFNFTEHRKIAIQRLHRKIHFYT